jgi:aminopeptidase N
LEKGLNVKAIMSSWELTPGFPLITISREKATISIKQERFLLQPNLNASNFWIPVNFVAANDPKFENTDPVFWIQGVSKTVITNSSFVKWWNDDWMIFNIKQTGYYRVNYDDNLWSLLIKELNDDDFNKIDVVNRAQLIDDSLNLARAGIIDYSIPFQILKYLRKETDYVPWAAADRGLNFLDRTISESEYYPHFLNFMQENINLTYSKFGVTINREDTNFDRHVRNLAINWACKIGIESCLESTTDLLKEFIKEGKEIHPDLQVSVYCNGLKNSSEDDYNFFLKKLENSLSSPERALLITSLGCSGNRDHLNTFIENTINGVYKTHEFSTILNSVALGGPIGLELTLETLKEKYSKIHDRQVFDFFKNKMTLIPEYLYRRNIISTLTNCAKYVATQSQNDMVIFQINYWKDTQLI